MESDKSVSIEFYKEGFQRWSQVVLALQVAKRGSSGYIEKIMRRYVVEELEPKTDEDHVLTFIRNRIKPSKSQCHEDCKQCVMICHKIRKELTKGRPEIKCMEGRENLTKDQLWWTVCKIYINQYHIRLSQGPQDVDPQAVFYLLMNCKLFDKPYMRDLANKTNATRLEEESSGCTDETIGRDLGNEGHSNDSLNESTNLDTANDSSEIDSHNKPDDHDLTCDSKLQISEFAKKLNELRNNLMHSIDNALSEAKLNEAFKIIEDFLKASYDESTSPAELEELTKLRELRFCVNDKDKVMDEALEMKRDNLKQDIEIGKSDGISAEDMLRYEAMLRQTEMTYLTMKESRELKRDVERLTKDNERERKTKNLMLGLTFLVVVVVELLELVIPLLIVMFVMFVVLKVSELDEKMLELEQLEKKNLIRDNEELKQDLKREKDKRQTMDNNATASETQHNQEEEDQSIGSDVRIADCVATGSDTPANTDVPDSESGDTALSFNDDK